MIGIFLFFIFECLGSTIQNEFQSVLETFILKHTLGALKPDTRMPIGMCLPCKTQQKFMQIINVSDEEYDMCIDNFKGDLVAFQQDITSVNNTFQKSIDILLQLIQCKEKELIHVIRNNQTIPLDFGQLHDIKRQNLALNKLREENCKRAISTWSKDCALLYKQKEFNILLAQKIFMKSVTRKCVDLNHQHYNVFYKTGDDGEQEIAVKLKDLTSDIRNMHIQAIQAQVNEDTIETRLRALQGVSNESLKPKAEQHIYTDDSDFEKDSIPLIPISSV